MKNRRSSERVVFCYEGIIQTTIKKENDDKKKKEDTYQWVIKQKEDLKKEKS